MKKIPFLLILITFISISCIQKGVDKINIDTKNKTVTLVKYIRDSDLTWIYLSYEYNVKFKDVDSIVKVREKELDYILSEYKTIK